MLSEDVSRVCDVASLQQHAHYMPVNLPVRAPDRGGAAATTGRGAAGTAPRGR